jgi:hypothetical protein
LVLDEIAARCNLDVDCGSEQACVNGYCRDPCVGYCKGLWKKCEVVEHKPRCACEINTYPADDGNCLLNSGKIVIEWLEVGSNLEWNGLDPEVLQ